MGDIFDIIREKANRHEDPVPGDAWDNILREKRRRRPAAFFWIAAALLLIVAGIGSYRLWLHQSPEEQTAGNKNGLPISHPAEKTYGIPDDQSTSAATADQINPPKENQSATAEIPQDKMSGNNIPDIRTQRGNNSTHVNEMNGLPSGGKKIRKEVSFTVNNPAAETLTVTDKRSAAGRKNKRKSNASADVSIINGAAGSETGNKPTARNEANNNQSDLSVASEKKTGIRTESPVVNSEPESPATAAVPAKETVIEKTKPANEKPAKEKEHVAGKEEKKHKRSGWILDLGISPVSFISGYNHNTQFSKYLFENDNKTEFNGKLTRSHINPSVAFSLLLRKELNPRMNIGLGIQYLEANEMVRISGRQVNTQYFIGTPHLNPGETPEWVTDTISNIMIQDGDYKATNRYRFISIPISFQYRLWERKKWALGLDNGISILLNTRYTNRFSKPTLIPLVNRTDPSAGTKNGIGFSINSGIRLSRRMNEKTEWYAMPYIGINPVKQEIRNTPVNKHIHRAGIQFGLNWRF